jgi:hypothetical protein
MECIKREREENLRGLLRSHKFVRTRSMPGAQGASSDLRLSNNLKNCVPNYQRARQ